MRVGEGVKGVVGSGRGLPVEGVADELGWLMAVTELFQSEWKVLTSEERYNKQ